MAERARQFTENEVSPRLEYKPVKWAIPEELRGIISYNPRHDIQDFLDLANLQGKIPPQEFAQLQIQTINRTRRQLEKNLGERFRVKKSKIEYFLEDSILQNPDYYPEPVIERYERCREFLAENGSTETKRETAEVEGMHQIEKIFTGSYLQDGQKVIIISPKGPEGTLYRNNYFDVYKQVDGKIIMTRYHSTHDYQGFLKAARKADPAFDSSQEEMADDAYFCKNPIITSLSTDQILETFAIDLDTQSEKINQEIIAVCKPYVDYYIRVLEENPLNIKEIKKALNTVYNVADEAEREIGKGPLVERESIPYSTFATVERAVNFYGQQPVRTVSNGCRGGQQGFSLNQPGFLRNLAFLTGARSIVDFAPFVSNSNEDTSDFPCPQCGHMITYGAGIKQCPRCELPATCG